MKSGAEILQEIEDLGLMKVTELGADEANGRIGRNSGRKSEASSGICHTGVHFLSVITLM